MAGLSTFEMLAARIADWRPDSSDPASDAHLVWATMHGLVSIELMHRRWGGPLVAHLQGDPEQNIALLCLYHRQVLRGELPDSADPQLAERWVRLVLDRERAVPSLDAAPPSFRATQLPTAAFP